MVRVVIRKKSANKKAVVPSWDSDRKAVYQVTGEKESHAYRETKAAGIPVTYVSGRRILRESGGECKVIGRVAPRVKVLAGK